ncbi:MAG: hypothetical protein LKF15_10635 [Lachnospiraceae bacterium]|nr:hypothetical protein [Lachnospiraceae bacterium]MCH4067243.1 hypothetical protein [Lachnospiraceae bacterium]MCH4113268.1 hypothetical protein [Lachnospiraceae bacterium]
MKNPKSGGDPYENLANAIIIQAADDYVAALKRIQKNPGNKAALHDAMSIENFFHSGWFGVLTSVDPDYLIEGLRKKVNQ